MPGLEPIGAGEPLLAGVVLRPGFFQATSTLNSPVAATADTPMRRVIRDRRRSPSSGCNSSMPIMMTALAEALPFNFCGLAVRSRLLPGRDWLPEQEWYSMDVDGGQQ